MTVNPKHSEYFILEKRLLPALARLSLEIIAVEQFFHRSSLQGFEGFRFTSIYVIQYSEYYGFTVTQNTDTPDYVKYEGESRTV